MCTQPQNNPQESKRLAKADRDNRREENMCTQPQRKTILSPKLQTPRSRKRRRKRGGKEKRQAHLVRGNNHLIRPHEPSLFIRRRLRHRLTRIRIDPLPRNAPRVQIRREVRRDLEEVHHRRRHDGPVDVHVDPVQEAVVRLGQILREREQFGLLGRVQMHPCRVRFGVGVGLAREGVVPVFRVLAADGPEGAVRDAIFVVDVIPRLAWVCGQVDLVPGTSYCVPAQDGCDGAVEAGGVELSSLA